MELGSINSLTDLLNSSFDNKGTVIDLKGKSIIEIMEIRNHFAGSKSKQFFKNQSSLRFRLKELGKICGRDILPHQISDMFWNIWMDYLLDNNYKLSTIATMSSQLRAVIDWASRHNAEVNPTYSDLKVPKYYVRKVALTPDEVSWIYHFDIKKSVERRSQCIKTLELCRDAFVLSCCLGQRHSDMIRINKDCFDRNKFSIIQQKTGFKSYVDIDRFAVDKKMVYDILERYNYKNPYPKDLTNYNKTIKYLFKVMGFNDVVKLEAKIRGEIKTWTKYKWQMMSSHTARRTFATINVLRGYPIFEIRRATGHKTEEAFNRYICLDE